MDNLQQEQLNLLPKKQFYEYKQQNLQQLQDKKLQESIQYLAQYIKQKSEVYDITQHQNINLKIPESQEQLFKRNCGKNKKYEIAQQYEKKQMEKAMLANKIEYKEPIFNKKGIQILDKDMKKQIYEKAEFTLVRPETQTEETWRISNILQKGSEPRKKTFQYEIYLVFLNYIFLVNRILWGYEEDSYSQVLYQPQYNSVVNAPSFLVGLTYIILYPFSLINMIVGLPGFYSNSFKTKYLKALEQKRTENLIKLLQKKCNQKQIKQFIELTKIQDNKHNQGLKWQIIQQMQTDILQNNHKKNDFQNENSERDNLTTETQFNQQQNQFLKEQISQITRCQDFDEDEKQSFIQHLKASHIIDTYHQQMQKSMETLKENQISENLEKQNPIRSQSYGWLKLKTKQFIQNKQNKYIKERDQQILKDLKKEQLDIYYLCYKNYADNYVDENNESYYWKDIFLYIKTKFQNMYTIDGISIQREFLCNKVRQLNQNRYGLETETQYIISKGIPFWRIIVFFVRWFAWSINVIVALGNDGKDGELSIKSLFYCSPYPTQKIFNNQTGQYTYNQNGRKVKPVVCKFMEILQDIQRDRKQFEDQPDTGLLPKTIQRIFNLIYCYLIKFFLFDVLCVGILLPIIIILKLVITFAAAISVFGWMPAFLVLVWVFQWLFYDFDNTEMVQWLPLSSCPILQIFYYTIFDLLIRGVLQIVISVLLMVFNILAIILITIWAIIRYTLRTLYDIFCFQIIKCNGRVPKTDSFLAWKANYGKCNNVQIQKVPKYEEITFEAINNKFLFFLEQKFLEIYKNNIINLTIQNNQKQLNEVKDIFGILNVNYTDYNYNIGEHELRNKLDFQIQQRIQTYQEYCQQIQTSNVRFYENVLNHYQIKTLDLIKQYMQKKQNSAQLFAQLGLQNQDYQNLNNYTWKSIFHYDIFTPLDNVTGYMEEKEQEKGDQQNVNLQSNQIQVKILKNNNEKFKNIQSRLTFYDLLNSFDNIFLNQTNKNITDNQQYMFIELSKHMLIKNDQQQQQIHNQ